MLNAEFLIFDMSYTFLLCAGAFQRSVFQFSKTTNNTNYDVISSLLH